MLPRSFLTGERSFSVQDRKDSRCGLFSPSMRFAGRFDISVVVRYLDMCSRDVCEEREILEIYSQGM
jgi:hypothetical protein